MVEERVSFGENVLIGSKSGRIMAIAKKKAGKAPAKNKMAEKPAKHSDKKAKNAKLTAVKAKALQAKKPAVVSKAVPKISALQNKQATAKIIAKPTVAKIAPTPAKSTPVAAVASVKPATTPQRIMTTAQREREEALRAAAKVAESLATKNIDKPLTASEEKRRKEMQKPVDPKEAARAIKQIKASFFSSMATSAAPTAVTSSAASPFPPRIQALLDKQEIQDLMVSFARGMDRAEENLLRSVFHPDASVDFGPGIFQGSMHEFIAWALDVRGGMKATQHMIGNIRTDLRGDTALCETYFMIWHRLDKSTGKEDFFLAGRYLDKLERRPSGASGVWKIAHRKQVKDWTRTMPVAELFYHLNPDALWAHHGKQDLSYHIDNFPTGNSAKSPAFMGRRYDAKSMKV